MTGHVSNKSFWQGTIIYVAWHGRSWPRATVVAVEPDVDNVNLLRLNAPGVDILHAAIASQMCRVEIANPNDPAWARRTEEADQGTIEGITVPKILNSLPTCQPFICKIDIEGAEAELFSKIGQGVDHDYTQSRHWLREAALQGHAEAILELKRREYRDP